MFGLPVRTLHVFTMNSIQHDVGGPAPEGCPHPDGSRSRA